MPETPSASEVRKFDRRVSVLLRQAATAERDELLAIADAIREAQKDLREVAAAGDAFAIQLDRTARRLTALDETVARLIDDAVPAAAQRGVSLVDDALDVIAAGTRTQAVIDPLDGAIAQAKASTRKHLQDLNTRMVYELSRLRGPQAVPLDEVLAAIGTKLRGSPVFGAPSAFISGAVRATLGDVLGQAISTRSQQLADRDGIRTLKRWVHDPTVDEARESHVRASARYAAGIPWDQKFEIGSYRTLYPRGAGLPGAHRFGCRCQVAPVLSMEEPSS